MGLLLDEYLDSKQFKIVNEEVLKNGNDERSRKDINNMTFKDLAELMKARGKEQASNSVIELDVQVLTEEEVAEDAKEEKDKAAQKVEESN